MLKYILEHRISVIAIILMLLSLSLVSLIKLPVALFPETGYPAFSVLIETSPRSTEFMEKKVANVYLNAFQDIEHLLYVREIVSSRYCLFLLNFEWNTDMDVAYLKIKESLNRLYFEKEYLSQVVKNIRIKKIGGKMVPFMAFILPDSLKDFVKEDLIFRLGSIDGVGRVEVVGDLMPRYSFLYPVKNLYRYGSQVVDKVFYTYRMLKDPFSLSLRHGEKTFPILVNSSLETLEEFKNWPVSGNPIYRYFKVLREKPRENAIYQNKNYIAIYLFPSSQGSPISASKSVRNLLNELKVDYKILFDNSHFLKQTIRSLAFVLFYGMLFAIIGSFIFLGDVKVGFIVGVSIPLSILFTFIFIYLAGYSLNIITLGALILSSGMLIDASLIVIESIQDASSSYKDFKTAVIMGTKNVRSAVVSSMLTNCVVFIPVVFIYGVAGKLFFPFSMVVIVSTLFALFISLSIVPMLAYIAGIRSHSTKLLDHSIRFFKSLFYLVNAKFKYVGAFFILFLLLFLYSLRIIKFTMFPAINSKRLYVEVSDYSGLHSDSINNAINNILKIENGVLVMEDRGIKTWKMYLFDVKNRKEVEKRIEALSANAVVNVSDLDNPLTSLREKVPRLREKDYTEGIKLIIDAQKAEAYNVDIARVFEEFKSITNERNLGELDTVNITLAGVDFKNIHEVLDLPIKNDNNSKIPLSKIVNVDTTSYLLVKSSVWPSPKVPLYERQRTLRSVLHAVVFASILVLLAIIAVFESKKIASIAIWQIPISLSFVITILGILGRPIDIITGIGIIVLSGVSVNDAIVLVDFILRNKVKNPIMRITDAIERRTRSILITTITTVMGLLPLFFVSSAGARIQRGMAIVLILGLLFSTLTSMTLIPRLYLMFPWSHERHS